LSSGIRDSLADVFEFIGWEERKQDSKMELLPREIREKLPPLHSGEERDLDAEAVVKFFPRCTLEMVRLGRLSS